MELKDIKVSKKDIEEAINRIREVLKERRATRFKKTIDLKDPIMKDIVKEIILSYELNEKNEILGFIDFLSAFYMFYRKEKLSIRKKEFKRDKGLFIEYIDRMLNKEEAIEDYKKFSHIHGVFLSYLAVVDEKKKEKYDEIWIRKTKIMLYTKEIKGRKPALMCV